MAVGEARPPPPLHPKTIRELEPRAERYEVADGAAPGLRLRVLPSGAKSFRWYVNGAKPRRVVTLGHWSLTEQPGHLTLGQARLWMERLKKAHKGGALDKAEAELRQSLGERPLFRRSLPADGSSALLSTVAEDFMAQSISRRRKRPEQMRRILDRHIKPALGDKPVESITSEHCEAVVRAIAENRPVMATHVLAALRQMFKWAKRRKKVTENPAEDLDPMELGCSHRVCSRYLSAEEITLFWRALDASGMSPVSRAGLRALLCTGVRSCELLLAEWRHVDLEAGRWVIPVEVQKLTKTAAQSAKPWTVPLSSLALEQFRELKARTGATPWVMANEDGNGPVSDKSLGRAMRRLFEGDEPLLRFDGERPTPHDARRSVRSHASATLGVPWHVAERLLNHQLPGMSATYDASDYFEERKAALEKWAVYLRRLISPAENNVAFLPAVTPAA